METTFYPVYTFEVLFFATSGALLGKEEVKAVNRKFAYTKGAALCRTKAAAFHQVGNCLLEKGLS